MLHFLKILEDINNDKLNSNIKFLGIIFGKEKTFIVNKPIETVNLNEEYLIDTNTSNISHHIPTISSEAKDINLKIIQASNDTISAYINIKSQRPSDKFYIRDTDDKKGEIVGTISKEKISRIWNIKNLNFKYIQEDLKFNPNSKLNFIKRILFINKFYYNSDK